MTVKPTINQLLHYADRTIALKWTHDFSQYIFLRCTSHMLCECTYYATIVKMNTINLI